MEEKRILIISYEFIPYATSFGSCARIFYLTDFLVKHGYKVSVLTTAGGDKNFFGYEDAVDKINIVTVPDPFKKIKKSARGDNKKKRGLLISLRRITSGLFIPDEKIILFPRLYRAAIKIIKDQNIEIAIISSPPHSLQVTGLFLKRKIPSLRLIIDYRDGWNVSSVSYRKTMLGSFLSRRLERSILKSGDLFTYVSDPIISKTQRLLNLQILHHELIMNGFEYTDALVKTDLPSNGHIKNKLSIGYFGSLISTDNSYRNVAPFLKAIEENKELSSRIMIHFFGETIIQNYEYQDKEWISIHGSLRHRDAILEMKNMDALLIIHTQAKGCEEVITGKFFDYLTALKPILVVAPEVMEATKLVKRLKIGFNISYQDQFEIEKELLALLERIKSFKYPADLDIFEFTRSKQYDKFIKHLK